MVRRTGFRYLVQAVGLLVSGALLAAAFAQQPQAQSSQPLFAVNAKYANGVAPGYWLTESNPNSLTPNLSAGTAICGSPPTPVYYAGGTLTMTANATNYVYLNVLSSCAPGSSTNPFTSSEIPIAVVTAGASTVTSIVDVRTPFQVSSSGGSSVSGCLGQYNIQDYGASPANSASANGTAFLAAVTAAIAVRGTVCAPPGVYAYSGSSPLWFSSYANLNCEPGAILNYAGTGYPLEIGARGLTAGTADWNPYRISGCTFEGGASGADGLRINPYTVHVQFDHNSLMNFGNSSIFEVDYLDETWWTHWGPGNVIWNTDGVMHKGIRFGGTLSTSSSDNQAYLDDSLIGCNTSGSGALAVCGVGIDVVAGVYHIGPNMNIYGFSPNIQYENSTTSSQMDIFHNWLLLAPTDSTGNPVVEFGVVGNSATVNNLFVEDNGVTTNPLAVPLVGPATVTSLLGLARVADNHQAVVVTGPVVKVNALSGQGPVSQPRNLNWAGPQAQAVSTFAYQLTLANGANENIPGNGAEYITITGPTSAFSLGGFVAGYDGEQMLVQDRTTEAMTVNNQDTGSLAAARIYTASNANVVLSCTYGCMAHFHYDGADSLWVLDWHNP